MKTISHQTHLAKRLKQSLTHFCNFFCVVHIFLWRGDEGIFSGKKCQVSQFCWKCGLCVPTQVASFRLMFTFVAFKWTRFRILKSFVQLINIKHPRDICQSNLKMMNCCWQFQSQQSAIISKRRVKKCPVFQFDNVLSKFKFQHLFL